MLNFTKDLGIDLGTSNILIYAQGRGVVLREPAVVAMDRSTGRLLKVGAAARNMLGRTPGNVVAIHPLHEGVISDYEMTELMLAQFFRKIARFSIVKPRAVICVPSGISEVEERAVIQSAMEAGARRVYLVEGPLAAALGAGLDITQAQGRMVVDIGGGTSDIAVLSLNGIVTSSSIKVAGDKFDEAIVRYVRRRYNLIIGETTAEEIKMSIGCVCDRPEELMMLAKGRDAKTSLPAEVTLHSTEMVEALRRPVNQIIEQIHVVLERTPPELVTDISASGITLTGGGGLVWGFDQLIEQRTGIACRIADDAESCVAIGCGKCLRQLSQMQEGTINLARRKLMAE